MGRLLAALLALALSLPATAANVHVASAANFNTTLAEIASRFEAESGHRLTISSASTAVLYTQIVHGAPFDILLAADSERPRLLETGGYAEPGNRFAYAWGKLVLAYQPQLSELADQGVAELLASPGLDLVIANPELAPYGQAADAVLQRHPLAGDGRLLRATNVVQAYQMWFSGGADAALLAKSSQPARYLEVPANWYPPLEQQAVLLGDPVDKPAATSFMEFLRSPAVRALIEEHGYGIEAPRHD